MTDNRPRWLAAVFVALVTAAWTTAAAQTGLPLLDDASALPRGMARLRVPVVWTRYDQRFGQSGLVGLGAPYTSDSLGASSVPPLANTQSLIAAAAASPFSLSLGKSRLDVMAREEHMPITLEYGLLSRLSVSVMVPIIRKRLNGLLRLDSLSSNVGPNPQRFGTTAAVTNNQVQQEFTAAWTQLQSQLANCTLGAAGCANLSARQAEAQALITSSQSFATTVGSLYGKTGSTGEAFVPRSSSAAQGAIAARVAAFNTQFKDLLSSSANLITAVPVGAAGPAGAANLAAYVLGDLGRDSISSGKVFGIGDVELGMKYLLINRMRDSGSSSLRLLVASTVSFPSGTRESPVGVADLHIANGAVGFDVRGIAEWKVGRAALIGTGSVTSLGKNASMPATDTRFVTTEWEPRWHISAPLSIHGSYALRNGDFSGTSHLAGGGVSFLSLGEYRRGDHLPMEMRYSHLETIKGAIGTPKFTRDQLEVRIYYQPGWR